MFHYILRENISKLQSFSEYFSDFNVQSGDVTYKINLKGHMKGFGSECGNAAVCQTKPEAKSLGDVGTVKYFIAGKYIFLSVF